ncbi:unnamed protein product [Heterobilharzia americana]|nr:unnamed protein product [Heterobilharzia americana]
MSEDSSTLQRELSVQRPVAPESESLYLLCGIKKPVIHNMVSTVDLGCPIELRKLVLHVRSAEYNPRRFPGVVIRLREPRVTCLVFRTGRMVCTGARSEMDANLGSRKCARIIQKLGFDVKFMNFKIQIWLVWLI